MITNTITFCQLLPSLDCCFFPEDLTWESSVFFDIETTGLSPRTSRVYLIGAIYLPRGASSPILVQYLAEDSSDDEEAAVLQAFYNLLADRSYAVHFNGTSFDVPYLIHRYEHHRLPSPLASLVQEDLYRHLKHFKPFFCQMGNHRQKSFENLVSYPRKDLLSGKELIKIYQIYEKSREPAARDAIFLHNEDDLKGMLSLLPLSRLSQLETGSYHFKAMEEVEETDYQGTVRHSLLLTLQMPQKIPAQLSVPLAQGYLMIQKDLIKIKTPIFEGTLKYFYPDYKNYYYLPYEDEAVHKSVGIYTDPSRRQKASAATCYRKISGRFLFAPGNPALPLCRQEYKAQEAFTPYPFQEPVPENALAYAKGILQKVMDPKT